jgi:hypothetical protein
MVAKVTKNGLLIPKRLLQGITQVEIRRVGKRITLTPSPIADPLRGFGEKPVQVGCTDGSVNHDAYAHASGR